jgi:hypothetical protein
VEVEDDVGAVKWVPLSAREGEEKIPFWVGEEVGPWAIFLVWARACPGALSNFFELFYFLFSVLFETFANKFKVGLNKTKICKILPLSS